MKAVQIFGALCLIGISLFAGAWASLAVIILGIGASYTASAGVIGDLLIYSSPLIGFAVAFQIGRTLWKHK